MNRKNIQGSEPRSGSQNWGIRNKTKTDLKIQMEHKESQLKTVKV